MKEKILSLQNESAILEPDTGTKKRLFQFMEIYADNFLESLEENNAFNPDNTPDPDRLTINSETSSLDEIYKIFREEVDTPGLNPASGGHLGYIPGGGILSTAVSDFIAAVSNRYAGLYFGGPGAVRLENRVLDWIKNMLHYPQSAVGNLTSGGSIANLIAITAARDAHEIMGVNVSKAVIYLSPHTHHCIHKALRIAGLGNSIIREVELDANHNMKPSALKEMIDKDLKEGNQPFLIVASAGTTNIGNIDPIERIADIAEEQNLWFHVDAAYGGFFILLDELEEKFKGIERSDSVVIDPHKGMFISYGLGAVLVKDKATVFKSHHYRASYLQDASKNDIEYSPADLSPELTKHFRGLRMWLPLKLYGIKPFISALREKRYLCLYFMDKIKELGFETGPEPELSIGIFRYNSELYNNNDFNRELINFIHEDGRVFLSSTVIDNSTWIRVAVLCFRTHLNTVDLCLTMIRECLELTQNKMSTSLNQ